MSIEVVSTTGLLDAVVGVQTRRSAGRGELVRIRRGTYADAAQWAAASPRDRHRTLVRAVAATLDDRLVVSHGSAAAQHGLPWIGGFGAQVVVADPARDRGQDSGVLRRVGAAGREIEVVLVDGVPVTSLAATAVDVALHEHPWRAIVVLDAVLRRGVDHGTLVAELASRGTPRARRRAEELIDVADVAAESPGESITRWGAHVLGAPTPLLQHGFPNEWGGVERVDFWFPSTGTIVEFDGAVKYTDPRTRNGRTAEEVLFAEKRREDGLRSRPAVHGFGRVAWADAMPGGQLPRRLHDAGVPLGRNWATAWRAAAHRTL
jgi:predicted transcriptional regulator of viral defense system